MKKIIAAMIVVAFGWAMTADAQVFGVAFGRPGISVAVPLPSVYVGGGPGYYPAPAYAAPAPYYPSPYYGSYYGGYYPYAYGPSVSIAPYWGWGGRWGWGGGWGRGGWGGGWRGGGGWGGGWHGGGGGGHGHR